MKITRETKTRNMVTVSADKYLKLLRTEFNIVECAGGHDELQALSESVAMKTSDLFVDRDMKKSTARLSVALELREIHDLARDYADILVADITLDIEEEKTAKMQKSNDNQAAYLGGDV